MREELKRQRKNSKRPWLISGIVLIALLAIAAGIYYRATLDQRLEQELAGGEEQVAMQDYEGALTTFRDIHRNHPDFHGAPRALLRSGEILNHYLQRYHEAILAYLLVEKDYPASPETRKAQRQVAETYKDRLGDHGQAIVAYQKLLDGEAADADRIRYEVADSYFRLNNYEQARIEFESLLKKHPGSPLVPEVQFRIAVAYSLEGASQEAERAYRAMAESWPDSPYAAEARFGLATVLEERDELRAAIKVLEALQGNYPNAEALAKKIEQVKERIGKKKKAI